MTKTRLAPTAVMLFGLISFSACDAEEDYDDGIAGAGDVVGDDDDAFRANNSFPGITDPNDLCTGTLNDGYGLFRYCRNRSVYSNNSTVTRAIILIHGSGSNAKTQYYEPTLDEAVLEGVNLAETDIIALQYFDPKSSPTPTEQAIYDGWEGDNYYLWSGDWKWGGDADTHARSSFDIVDHVIGELMDHRPNLETIVVAGQSGGGQFVDRYSTTTSVATPGVDLRFWAANSYTYLWYDSTRPGSTTGCSGYNNYEIGLSNLTSGYPYMVGKSTTTIRQNAVDREIYWTVGENDTSPLSSNCRYNAQGIHRQDRWQNHRDHIVDRCTIAGYGWGCLDHYARHIEIPGVGHGYQGSLESTAGHDILFN